MSTRHRMEITASKSHGDSPASKVMNEAIELAIAEESPFPEEALFVDADTPHTDREIDYAGQQGHSVVLVSPDGDIQIIAPEEIDIVDSKSDTQPKINPARQSGR